MIHAQPEFRPPALPSYADEDQSDLFTIGQAAGAALRSPLAASWLEQILADDGGERICGRYVEVQLLVAAHEVRAGLRQRADPSWAVVDAAFAALVTILPHPAFACLRSLMQNNDRRGPQGLKIEAAAWNVANEVTRRVLESTDDLLKRAPQISLQLSAEFPFTDDEMHLGSLSGGSQSEMV